MLLTDYHTHSVLSPDGNVPLARMADAAVAAGLACAAVYNPDSGAQDLSPARWRLNSLYELPALLDGN